MAWPVKSSTKVPDHYGTLVSQESRRLTGVTPKLTRAYTESPARFLPKANGLRGLARARKV